jgi:hypothetical protein
MPELKMSAYLLSQTTLEAVSNQMLLTCDSLAMCEQILDKEVKEQVISIINNKKHLIDGYVAILNTDWLILKAVYLEQWKNGAKKPQLPPYDLKLFESNEEKKKVDPQIVKIAKDYFGDDKVKIKE